MTFTALEDYDLILFGDYGVLTGTPFKDHEPLHLLPGRQEALAALQQDRARRGLPVLKLGVCGNKGGVAWGKHSEAHAEAEVEITAKWIGATYWRVCFGCPTCAAGFERYTTPEMLARRKPNTAMFREIAEEAGVPFAKILIVDHFEDGAKAAHRLGAGFLPPMKFFRQAWQLASQQTALATTEEEDTGLPEPPPADDLDLLDIDTLLAEQQQGGNA